MKKKSRGFTLVELLVAVAILAIIVSIAFALYNNFSKGAKETATVITKQNLVNAAQLYAKEFKTNPDFWHEEIINDVPTGNDFTCTTIKQLKNKGILQGKLIYADTEEEIADDTTIKITRDTNMVITSQIETDSAQCDKTPPVLTIDIEGNLINDWYTGEINYTITPEYGFSGISEFDYYIEIDSNKTTLDEVDEKYVYKGKIEDDISSSNIKICAWAMNGNDIESQRVCEQIKLDNTNIEKPNVVASDNITSNNWHKNTFTLNISGGGNPISGKYYQYRKDNDNNYTKVSNNKINIVESDHNKTIYVKTCSNINKCSEEVSYKVLIDKVAPTITNVSKSTTSYVSSLTIKATIADSLSGIAKYKIDKNSTYVNSGWTSASGQKSLSINKSINSDGTYYIWVEDKAGNYTKSSININNIATLKTTTVTLNNNTTSNVSSNKSISGIKSLQSVTVNNGRVLSSYLSGSRVYFSLGGGSSTAVPTTQTVSVSANSSTAKTRKECWCDSGDRLSGTRCIGKMGGQFVNTQRQYWSCLSNRWTPNDQLGVNDSNRSCQQEGYPAGYEKDISNYKFDYYNHKGEHSISNCEQYITNYNCNSAIDTKPVLKYRNCYADCKKPDYDAYCGNEYYCSSGTLIGSRCYSCSRGRLNKTTKRCTYNTTVYNYVYNYTVTIKYYS